MRIRLSARDMFGSFRSLPSSLEICQSPQKNLLALKLKRANAEDIWSEAIDQICNDPGRRVGLEIM